MSILNRNFDRLMMGVFSRVCSGVLWGRGGLQFRVLGGEIVPFLGRLGREGVVVHGVRVVFTSMSRFQTAQISISILYNQSLWWWFLYYISSLCGGGFSVCVCRHVLVRCV